MDTQSLASVPNDALLLRLAGILRDARRVEADLIAHIAEVDARGLFLREACSTLCCSRCCARDDCTSRASPLAPHLTEQNRDEVLARASHLSKRQIAELVATIAPRPDAPTLVRKLPERERDRRPVRALPTPGGQHRPDDAAREDAGPADDPCRALARPTTAARAVEPAMDRLPALSARPASPRADGPQSCHSPQSASVDLPAAVKRAVRLRDGDQCAHIDTQGRRCTERSYLEFHHRNPHGYGGDRSPSNIAQMCRRHNAFEATHDFGVRQRMTSGSRNQ